MWCNEVVVLTLFQARHPHQSIPNNSKQRLTSEREQADSMQGPDCTGIHDVVYTLRLSVPRPQ